MLKWWQWQDKEEYNRKRAGEILKRQQPQPVPEQAPRRPVMPTRAPQPQVMDPLTRAVLGLEGIIGKVAPGVAMGRERVAGLMAPWTQFAQPYAEKAREFSMLSREQIGAPAFGQTIAKTPWMWSLLPEEQRRQLAQGYDPWAQPGPLGITPPWGAPKEIGAGLAQAVRGGGGLPAFAQGLQEGAARGREITGMTHPLVAEAGTQLFDPLGMGGGIIGAQLTGPLGLLYKIVDYADLSAFYATATPEELRNVAILLGSAAGIRKAVPFVLDIAKRAAPSVRRFMADQAGAVEMPRRAAKEPWEMGYREWLAAYEARPRADYAEQDIRWAKARDITARGVAELERLSYGVPDWEILEGEQLRIPPPERHRKIIEKALAEGKPVPPEVLADYPDLTPTAPLELRAEEAGAVEMPGKVPGVEYPTPPEGASDLVKEAYKERLAAIREGLTTQDKRLLARAVGRGELEYRQNPNLPGTQMEWVPVVKRVEPSEMLRPPEVPPEEAARLAREAQEAAGQRRLGAAPEAPAPPPPVTRPITTAEPVVPPGRGPAVVPPRPAQPVLGAGGIPGKLLVPSAGAAVPPARQPWPTGQPVQPPLARAGAQITPAGPAAGAGPPAGPPIAAPPTGPPAQLPLWGADNLELMRNALAWPKPTLKEKLARRVYEFNTNWLNKVAPLKELQKQTGVEVYNLARIVPGMEVAGESYARQYVHPIWETLGKETGNAEVYAHLRRALDFRDWSPKGKLPGGVQNAAEGLVRLERELGPQRMTEIEAALEEIWRLNDELILKPLRNEGFPVVKFYDIIKEKWPHYIAWYRQDFEWDEAFLGPGKQVANMTQRVLKRMKIEGSERRLTSGLARFEAEVIRTPGRVARNQTARALVQGLQALDATDGGKRAVKDVSTRTVDRGVIKYWEDGEQQVWQVPAWAERIGKGLDAEPANALMQMLNKASQPLRLGAVVYNPAFIPVNALRDSLSAWISEGVVPFGRQWWGSLVATIAKKTDWHDAARSGAFLSGFSQSVARTTELGKAKRLGKITVKSVGDLLLLLPRLTARANEVVEQTTRLAVFRKLKAEGLPELERAVRARECSLDFSKSGNTGRLVNMIVPFFNAGIQGAAKTVELVTKHPGRTLLRASPLMMISVMTYLWNQRYETNAMIPDYEHALNFVLQVGEGEKKADPRYPGQELEKFPIYLKLPKGPLVAGLMAPVEACLRIAFSQDDRSVVEHLLQAAGEVVRSQSPIGPDVGSLLPPVLGTALQLQVNKDFFRGEAIVPEWEEGRPREARYGPETTRQAIALGEKFKVSPRLIDFTVRDVLAGGGRTAGWLLDVALGALDYAPGVPGEARRQPLAREEEISRIPIARRFYGTRGTQQYRMAYKEMDKALEDARRALYESGEAARFGMGVTAPGRTATIEGVPYELAPEQRTEILQRSAPLVEFGFGELTRRPFYQEKDDLERRGLLDTVRRKIQANVRDQVLAGLTGVAAGPAWTQREIALLLDATEELEEYQAIPQYVGMSEEQARTAGEAMAKYNAMRRANPFMPTEMTRAIYREQDPRGAVLMEMAYSRRNPARRYFWAMHPLLSVFYSDLTEEEVESIMPKQESRLPSWAAVG